MKTEMEIGMEMETEIGVRNESRNEEAEPGDGANDCAEIFFVKLLVDRSAVIAHL